MRPPQQSPDPGGPAPRSAAERKIEVRVTYPLERGRIVLRTDADWDRDLEPTGRLGEHSWRFEVPADRPFLYFKPLLRLGDAVCWSKGGNYLALSESAVPLQVYPYFVDDEHCSACSLRELAAPRGGGVYQYRIFYPPGYHENGLRRYPVLYMQDGQNLFFPDEAYGGEHWRIAETLGILDVMNVLDQVIVVGIYPRDRTEDYTRPGYEAYGRFLTEVLKPAVDAEYRTLRDPARTAVMGSSLGGVVSLYLAWQYPRVFGMAACMSSTFGWKDDLAARVCEEPRRGIRIYLDSGWPGDNYEVTRDMRSRLRRAGYRDGDDLLYLAFPEALHNEKAWAMRAHLPFQFFFAGWSAAPLPVRRRFPEAGFPGPLVSDDFLG